MRQDPSPGCKVQGAGRGGQGWQVAHVEGGGGLDRGVGRRQGQVCITWHRPRPGGQKGRRTEAMQEVIWRVKGQEESSVGWSVSGLG